MVSPVLLLVPPDRRHRRRQHLLSVRHRSLHHRVPDLEIEPDLATHQENLSSNFRLAR